MVAAAKPEVEVRYSHEMAYRVAVTLQAVMSPHVERIEIAGSIRRMKPDVGDIELVIIPKPSWFDFTDSLLADGHFTKRHGWGPRNRFAVHVRSGIPIDMFVADPDAWGSALMIRTGPGELNGRLMRWLKSNDAPVRMHDHYHWWHGEQPLLTPNESDVFGLLGIPFIPPEQRTLDLYAQRLNDPARRWPDFSRWYAPALPPPAPKPDLFSAITINSPAEATAASVYDEFAQANRERYEALRQIEYEINRLYEEQKPPKLLTMPQVKERCETMELGFRLKRWALRLPLWWKSEIAQQWSIAAANWPHLHPDTEDFEALFWMQWSETGAKTYSEIAEENRWRYPAYMKLWNEKYGHLAPRCWWHERFGERPRKGEYLMNLDTESKLHMTPDHFAGQRVVILGQSGAGKTNTSGVWIEEMLPHMPMTILDIEGEHWGLAENHELLIVGRSEHAMLFVSVSQAGKLAEFIYRHRLSVILDMSDHDEMEMHQFVVEYFEALWECAFRVPVQEKQPYGIVIEECQEFIPQTRTTPSKELFKRYAKRGRKQGFTLVMTSQESQDVDKRVITQANIAFLHRVTHPNDKAIYVKYIPWKPAVVAETVAELQPGQAVVVHGDAPVRVQIRKRHAFHAGRTPTLSAVAQGDTPALRKLDEALLSELREALGTKAETLSQSGQQAIRIAELENTIQQLQRENEELATINDGLESVIDKLMHQPANAEAAAPVIVEDGEESYRSPTVIKRAIGAQTRNYERILNVVRAESRANRIALLYLHDNSERWYSPDAIAQHTKYSATTFRLTNLVDMGLIQRQKLGGKVRYRASIEQKLLADCGDLDIPELTAKLIKV